MAEYNSYPLFDRIIILLNPTAYNKIIGNEFGGYKIESYHKRPKTAQYQEIEVLKGSKLEPKVAWNICRELIKIDEVKDAEPLFYTQTPSLEMESNFFTLSEKIPTDAQWIFKNLYISEAWKLLPEVDKSKIFSIVLFFFMDFFQLFF